MKTDKYDVFHFGASLQYLNSKKCAKLKAETLKSSSAQLSNIYLIARTMLYGHRVRKISELTDCHRSVGANCK